MGMYLQEQNYKFKVDDSNGDASAVKFNETFESISRRSVMRYQKEIAPIKKNIKSKTTLRHM